MRAPLLILALVTTGCGGSMHSDGFLSDHDEFKSIDTVTNRLFDLGYVAKATDTLLYVAGTDLAGDALSTVTLEGLTLSTLSGGVPTAVASTDFTVTPISAGGGTVMSVASAADYSGSMADADIQDVADIFTSLVHGITGFGEMEVIRFSEFVTVSVPFTTDTQALLQGVAPDLSYPRTSTALFDAMGTAVGQLASRPPVPQVLVVATDGIDNVSAAYTQAAVESSVAAWHGFVLMLGNQYADYQVLTDLAGTRGAMIYTRLLKDVKAKALPVIDAIKSGVVIDVKGTAAGAKSFRVSAGSATTDIKVP